MQKKKPSINDLAKKLKISKTTISFILNGKAKEKRISDVLVEKVQKQALKLGYQPNQFAKSLRTGRTNIIGLMVEDISNSFYGSIAKIIEDKVYQNGYKVVYCSTENNSKRGKDFLNMFEMLGVDGCIIAPTMGMEEEIKALAQRGKGVVLFDRKFRMNGIDSVMVDNQEGIHKAVEHLASRGFKNIALIALALDKPDNEDRIIGYKKAVTDLCLKGHVYPQPFKANHEDYVADIAKILTDNKKLDAVIFGTNYLGIAGLKAIAKLKLKIPKDIAVACFDDHDLFKIYSPSITVVAQPIEEIAQTVIDTLLTKMKTPATPDEKVDKTITLSTTLIVRESTTP